MKGKLEGKIHSWMKELDLHFNRLYDARSFGTQNAPTRPADFYLYIKPNLIYIECKETKANSLAFSDIRPSQYKAAKNSGKYGYKYAFIIQIKGVLIGLKWELLEGYISSNYPKHKSINYKTLTDIGYFIQNRVIFRSFLSSL